MLRHIHRLQLTVWQDNQGAIALYEELGFEKEGLFKRAGELTEYFLDAMFSMSDLPVLTDIRGYGLLVGFDLKTDQAPGVKGLEVQKALYKNGLNLKATGDSCLVAPPLISEKEHIDEMAEKLRKTLSQFG